MFYLKRKCEQRKRHLDMQNKKIWCTYSLHYAVYVNFKALIAVLTAKLML